MKNVFSFLRLINSSNQISFTKLLFLVAILRLLLSPQLTFVDGFIALVAVLNDLSNKVLERYQVKEAVSKRVEELTKKVEEVDSKLTSISFSAGIKKL